METKYEPWVLRASKYFMAHYNNKYIIEKIYTPQKTYYYIYRLSVKESDIQKAFDNDEYVIWNQDTRFVLELTKFKDYELCDYDLSKRPIYSILPVHLWKLYNPCVPKDYYQTKNLLYHASTNIWASITDIATKENPLVDMQFLERKKLAPIIKIYNTYMENRLKELESKEFMSQELKKAKLENILD